MPLVQGRKRRAQPEEDAPTSTSPEPATQRRRISPDAEDEAYGGNEGVAQGPSSEMVKKMVRLALACEYHRKPIRRADISEKVLGNQGRQFKKVFEEAQAQLRGVFGMEMVELPARERVTVQQKRSQAATGSKPGTTSWILTSTLPSAFHHPAILPPPAAPTAAEDARYTSIYTLLIALIKLSGGALPDAKLERYLRRLGMEDRSPVAGCARTEQLLKRLERDGYLVKVRETATAGEEDVSWHVGPRGRVEVGDDGVRGLASAVYGDLDAEGERELDRRVARSLGLGERERAGPPSGVEKGKDGTGGEKKKRGRPRKKGDEEEEEEDDDDDDDDEEA